MHTIKNLPSLIASLALLSACSTGADNGAKPAVTDASLANPPTSVSTSQPQAVETLQLTLSTSSHGRD